MLGPLCYAVEEATELLALEGLPDPKIEGELYKQEKSSRECVDLHEHSFYARPLEIPTDLAEGLRQVSATANGFVPLSPDNARKPFHADFLLSWKSETRTCHLLIALHVKEVLFVLGRNKLRVGMRDATQRKLGLALAHFTVQRPTRR